HNLLNGNGKNHRQAFDAEVTDWTRWPKAVPTDVVKAIVGDYYKRAAPTPPAEKHSRRASREIWSEGRLIFDTMPSRPSLQACATRAGRSSWSRCPLECRPGAARASRLASVALTQASEPV